jgi:hypothetical protein
MYEYFINWEIKMLRKFKVYQAKKNLMTTKELDDAFFNTRFDASAVDTLAKNDTYRLVAHILATDLEDVFRISNMGVENRIARFDKMHSLSVGDIVEDEGNIWVCSSFGFTEANHLAGYIREHEGVA